MHFQKFTAWGLFVAQHSVAVIIVGLLVCVALACGTYFFTVTTDPVHLWSSPTSTARKEKEFFDKEFAPFYRTEQVIIRKKDNKIVTRKGPCYSVQNLKYSDVYSYPVMFRVSSFFLQFSFSLCFSLYSIMKEFCSYMKFMLESIGYQYHLTFLLIYYGKILEDCKIARLIKITLTLLATPRIPVACADNTRIKKSMAYTSVFLKMLALFSRTEQLPFTI